MLRHTSIRLVAILFASVALLFAATIAPAQPAPGDAVALTSNRVLGVTPSGVVTTLSRLPAGHVGLGLCMAFGNSGVAVLTRQASPQGSTLFVMTLTAGVWKTLGFKSYTGALTIGAQGGIERDQRGDYIAATPNGLLRVAGAGGQVTVIRNTMSTGLCDHLRADGWMGFAGGQLVHITRKGALTKLGGLGGPTLFGAGGVVADTVSGDAYLVFSRIYHFDVAKSAFTTLRASGIGTARCGDMDPASQTLVIGSSNGVYRVSRAGLVLGTFATLSTGVVGVTVFGSSQVAVFGPANPGTTSSVFVSFPTDPNAFYQLGASFGFRPGIPTNVGVIPLNPDAFFGLVFVLPGVFPGFGGQLDGKGVGGARIVLPKVPALVGLRFFLAGLSYQKTGRILTISEPVGMTVE